jgi:hypothetical protein
MDIMQGTNMKYLIESMTGHEWDKLQTFDKYILWRYFVLTVSLTSVLWILSKAEQRAITD